MGSPLIDPPAGAQWVLHRNVLLNSGSGTEDLQLVGGLTFYSWGWEGAYTIEPTFFVPDVVGNDRYWFDKWYFANFRLYLDHALTGEILGVQPAPDTAGPSVPGGSGSIFSAGQNIYVRNGQAWVVIDPRIGAGPGWPPILTVNFTLPRWGLDSGGTPIPADPRSGAGLIQWRGDVWVAEPVSSTTPSPVGPPPVVLQGTARPSAQAPKFQLHWPQRDTPLPWAEPGDTVAGYFPRWGFTGQRLMVYELYEHWWASAPGQSVETRYEREYTLVEPAGSSDTVLVWDGDAANWDEGVWGL